MHKSPGFILSGTKFFSDAPFAKKNFPLPSCNEEKDAL